MADRHPLLDPLAGVLGLWVGEGRGQLPDREPFTWRERFHVTHGGTPALSFRQRTTRSDGSPFHAEDGWVRVPPELQDDARPDRTLVELAVASPTGVLEALAGTAVASDDGLELDVTSTAVVGTPSAGHVIDTRRRWRLDGDVLVVEFWMATPADPERFHHLTATLHRSNDPGT